MNVICEFLISLPCVIGICVGIIGFAVRQWIEFAHKNLKSKQDDLDQGIKYLKGIADKNTFARTDKRDEFKSILEKQSPTLLELWKKFEATFIWREEGIDSYLITTHEPEEFFHEESTLQGINVDWYKSVPNILTGLGILGTFLGLTAGLFVAGPLFESGDSQAVVELIKGASLAFLTSLAGLFCSLVFAYNKKKRLHYFNTRVGEWNGELHRLIKVTHVERVLCDQLDEVKKHTVELKRFNTDLALSIAQALDKPFSEHMNRLVTTLERIERSQQKPLEESLSGLAESFRNALSEGAKDEIRNMASQLGNMNQSLGATVAGLNETLANMGESSKRAHEEMLHSARASAEQVTQSLNAGLSQFGAQMQSTTSQLQKQLLSMSQSAVNASQQMSENLKTASSEVAQLLKDAIGTAGSKVSELTQVVTQMKLAVQAMSGAAEQSGAMMHEFRLSMTTLKALPADIKATMDSIQNAMQPTIQGLEACSRSINQSSQALIQSVEQMKNSSAIASSSLQQVRELWERYSSQFNQTESAMARVMEKITTSLDSYTQRINELNARADELTSNAVSKMSGVIGEMSDAIEELQDAVSELKDKAS